LINLYNHQPRLLGY